MYLLQELLGLGLADAGFAGEALGAHAVDHAEVDRLAQAPLFRGHLVFVEQQPGREGVHVVAVGVGLHQHLLAAEVGEDAQLDLGVVGADQLPALLGQERLADAPAELGADGDVLQVGVDCSTAARWPSPPG